MPAVRLNEFEAKPHPVKALLKKHNVALATVANYLGVSYTYTCSMINGIFRVPQHHEEKLAALMKHLEGREAC